MKRLKTSVTNVTRTRKTPTLHTKPLRVYPIGINHNFLSSTSLSQIQNTYIPPMLLAGIKWARYEMVMVDQQPTQGVFDFTGGNYDARVDAIRGAGLEIIALLDFYSVPTWAKAAGGAGWNARPTPAVYGEWCRNVALHYKGKIRFYEMGNEPNYTIYWPSYPNYFEYLDMLIAGYNGIKAGDPDAKVISGGLGGAINAPSDWIPTATFLDGLLHYGAANYYDYLAVHPYPDSIADTDINSTLNKITAWRTIQTNYGDTKPMVLTEVGRPTSSNGITDAQQATWAASLFTALMGGSYDYVKFICWHNFKDDEAAITTDSEKHYGITYYPNFNAKPSFQSFIDAKNSFRSTYRELVIA